MKETLRILIYFTLLLSALFPAAASEADIEAILKQLNGELASAKTARDSVRILYNIFDVSNTLGKAQTAWILYDAAGRADDQTAQQDMLRNLAVFYVTDDSVISSLLKKASLIRNPDSRNATRTFITNQYFSKISKMSDRRDFGRVLLDSINNSHNMMNNDRYDKLSLMHQLIIYLGSDYGGSLFSEIFEKYNKMVAELPLGDYPLKNQYLLTMSDIYTRYGEHDKAIDCELQLLDISDKLHQKNLKRQRKYINYDVVKFRCFERILLNFKGLSAQQIEAVHDSMQYYYHKNPSVRTYAHKSNLMDGIYYYATGRYREAIPELQKAIDYKFLSDFQKVEIYDYLAESAKAAGDTRTQIMAMEQARRQLTVIDSMRRETALRESSLKDYLEDKPIFVEVETAIETSPSLQALIERHTLLLIVSGILTVLLILYMTLYLRLRFRQAKPRK